MTKLDLYWQINQQFIQVKPDFPLTKDKVSQASKKILNTLKRRAYYIAPKKFAPTPLTPILENVAY